MAVSAFKLKLHSCSAHKVLWVEETLPETYKKKKTYSYIYISESNQSFLAFYLVHSPVEKYSLCDIESKIIIIFAWQRLPIWETKIRHSEHVFLDLVLTVLHKVWKWLQRAVEQAQECTGSWDHCGCPCRGGRGELALYLHIRRLTTDLLCVGHLLRVGKSEMIPEHRVWWREISLMYMKDIFSVTRQQDLSKAFLH